ncbi:flagellar biosynthetic protein FliR [Spirochaetota bacterium]|nr:flagellar biosynthetic protein FliR [Spirochaetota bacterium]
MESLNFMVTYLNVFLMIWARLMGMFVLAPVFGSPVILMRFRVLFAFAITLCVAPALSNYIVDVPENFLEYILLLLKEFTLGAIIGLFLAIIFAAFSMSAQLFSAQIGLAIAEIFDALTNEGSSLWGYFFYMTAILVFIQIGGMHLVVRSLVESYEVITAIDYVNGSEKIFNEGVRYFTYLFIVALKISFPIVTTATILLIALGVLGKFIPQANILILGLPIQLSLGFLFIFATIPFMIGFFGSFLENAIKDIFQLAYQLRKV